MEARAARDQSAALRFEVRRTGCDLPDVISIRYRTALTIRWRTETSIGQRVVGAFAVVGLAGAAGLHALWANGSPWPASNWDELADAVVGRRPFPSQRSTWTVAALLATAAATISVRSGLVPFPGGREMVLVRVGSKVAAATLLARGAAVSAFNVGATTPAFRRWNLAVYSPLCLALGAAMAIASRSTSAST